MHNLIAMETVIWVFIFFKDDTLLQNQVLRLMHPT